MPNKYTVSLGIRINGRNRKIAETILNTQRNELLLSTNEFLNNIEPIAKYTTANTKYVIVGFCDTIVFLLS